MPIHKIVLVYIFLFVSFYCEATDENVEVRQISQMVQKMVPYLKARTVAIRVAIAGQYGFGSGAIISSDGIILTCAHVSEISDNLTVVTSEGKSYPAKTLGKNSVNDYSLLKIEEKNLPYFELGDSSQLKILQWAIALGHPGGPYPDNQPAVNTGRIRGLHKKLPIFLGWKFYDDAIQTDTPIFAGNSGGPLIDLKGRLIGINGAIMLVNDLTFSVPIDKIKKDLPAMKQGRNIEGYLPGFFEWIGILTELQEDIPEEDMEKIFKDAPLGKILKFLGSTESPAKIKPQAGIEFMDIEKKIYVSEVQEEGIAFLSGLQAKDRILSIGNKPVKSIDQIQRTFAQAKFQDRFKITFLRDNISYTVWFIFDKKAYSRESLLKRAFEKEGMNIRNSTVKIFSGNDLKGHGVVLSKEGYILTTLHILKTIVNPTVQMPEQKNIFYKADIIGSDGIYDLALLKIEPNKNLIAIPFSKEKGKIGEWVISGGDENGVIQAGMISALERTVPNQRKIPTLGLFGLLGKTNKGPIRAYSEIIQHDANLEAEHFGTPLCNEKGEMIGINVGHFYRGTVFATPLASIEKALPELFAGKHISATREYQTYEPEPDPYGRLLDYFLNPDKKDREDIKDILKDILKQPEQNKKQGFIGIKIADHPRGIVVLEVIPGYAGAKAGIKTGDVLIEINNQKIDYDILAEIRSYGVGTRVHIALLRLEKGEYKRIEMDVFLSEMIE